MINYDKKIKTGVSKKLDFLSLFKHYQEQRKRLINRS